MKKLLILFAKEFPYGVSEPFLELEYPLYKDYFDKVLIVTNKTKSKTKRGEKTREVNDPIIEILESEFDKNLFWKLKLAWNVLTDGNFYKEVILICKSRKKIASKIKALFSVIGKADLCVELAHKKISELEKKGYKPVAAYAYWLMYPAYAAVKLSKTYYSGELYTVSRAHRFDLYEYRNKTKYLPCRNYILSGLSEIASISDDGKKYLETNYPALNMNISIQRLGAKSIGNLQLVSNQDDVLRIVSCARVVPVKRIDRIIDALMSVHNFNVEWTHIGGGDLLEDIKSKASELPDNVSCIFTGTISNTEVYQRYRDNKYHVFVNVSESEGVPVSIMEAMCFGTPVIATDVGGVSEMINQGENGYLLSENFKPEQLVEYLNFVHKASAEEYEAMRTAAHDVYENKYNALTNYSHFLKELSER